MHACMLMSVHSPIYVLYIIYGGSCLLVASCVMTECPAKWNIYDKLETLAAVCSCIRNVMLALDARYGLSTSCSKYCCNVD